MKQRSAHAGHFERDGQAQSQAAGELDNCWGCASASGLQCTRYSLDFRRRLEGRMITNEKLAIADLEARLAKFARVRWFRQRHAGTGLARPMGLMVSGRPKVDVVVPFAGSAAAFDALLGRLDDLRLRDGDTMTVVDNGPPEATQTPRGMSPTQQIVAAPELASSYYARNCGAARGVAEWIVFLDADVTPPVDLLDRYFDPGPPTEVGVLVGTVDDEPLSAASGPVARYLSLTGSMSQANTWSEELSAYAQTANCAVRRSAFIQAGGFRGDVRSGGDGDLCFRLRQAGWRFEQRPGASVVHANRTTLRALVRQRARHGSGATWLARAHPGSVADREGSRLGLAWWSARRLVTAARAALRGEHDDALRAALDPVSSWAFELGRALPNEAARREPASRGTP